jgi:hypothetical protein
MADEAGNSAAFRSSLSRLRVVLRRSATVAKGEGLHKRRKKFMFVNGAVRSSKDESARK